jgi:AAHS family 4-hydroxybenzoate transporter-like MFS transporter
MVPQEATSDIKAFIDRQPFTRFQATVLGLCILVMAFDAIDLTAMGLIAPALSDEWGIAKAALSPALTASIVGTCVGALVGGPLADGFGRKKILIASALSFGLFTVACAFAPSIAWLAALRFLGGIGIGAASPVANTVASEFASERYRALACNSLLIGFTLGATAGGLGASWLIPHWGWRSVLLIGGGIPILLGLLLLFLPESLQFMVARRWPAPEVAAVLERIRPGSGALAGVFRPVAGAPERSSLVTVFRPQYLAGTVVLWLVYFLGLVIYYVMTSWLPTLVHSAGFTVSRAATVMAMFPLGGAVGTLGLGLVMERLGSVRVIAATYAAAGVMIWLVGSQASTLALLYVLVFAAGATLNGAQLSMPALSAGYYPTLGRATGTSWMVGFGRVGGIFGAMAGGILLELHWSFAAIFAVLSLPAFVAAAALLVSLPVFARARRMQLAEGSITAVIGN